MPTPTELQTARDRESLKTAFSLRNPLVAAAADIGSLPGRGIFGAANTALRLPRALGLPIPFIPEGAFGGDSSSLTPFSDRLRPPAPVSAPVAALPAPVTSLLPAVLPRLADNTPAAPAPVGQNYFVNNRTGVRTDLNFDPAEFTPSPVVSGLPRLAGPREDTGYQPTTLAGALVKNQENKRQSVLQGQDIQTALQAYDAAGRGASAAAELGERRIGREGVAATAAAKLAENKRQFDSLQGLPKLEYRTKYEAGLPVGTEVFDRGQLVPQPTTGVTVEAGKEAIKAGAPKAEVNKRLVAAGLAAIP